MQALLRAHTQYPCSTASAMLIPKHQTYETHAWRGQRAGSRWAGLDVWCSSNRQEVGLRARLDGEQLLVRGRAQCVSCVQAGHGPSSTTRFSEIPRKPHNPSGWYFYMEKEECAFEKMVRWQAYSWERELLNHSQTSSIIISENTNWGLIWSMYHLPSFT